MDPRTNQQSTSGAAGSSNWHIDDLSHRNRLEEDIAVLQSQFERLPPSPETTAGPARRPTEIRVGKQRQPVLVDDQQLPPHMDPRLPSEPAHPLRNANVDIPPPTADGGRQERLDAKLAKQVRDFKEAEFLLKQSKLVGTAIQTGKAQFRQANTLKADGANFADWYQNLAEVRRAAVDDARFFITACKNSTYKKIARALLISSINQSLVAEMQQLPTCFAMYTSLVNKFKTSSHAAQMLIFYKFRRFKINPDGHNAGIASTLRDWQAEWAAVNVKFGMDAFMGFVLQSAVMESNAEYKKDFELRVKQLVRTTNRDAFLPHLHLQRRCPPQCRRRIVSMFSAFLADVDEQDWVDALDFYALTAHKCWQCGGENHYARNCPEPQQSTHANRKSGPPIGTIAGTLYGHLPSGASVNSSRFSRTNFKKTQFPPSRN
ncbi:hypothetical protein PTTG_27895 [Puccinia triticina 1-1 BBBD Race 1]|uniref:CCHC-type domain-containing protein n=1 Tax=Puccinia triticina (isolate 1-1 / race 1 (BBBD)) TaxID=630390 RepID=A0A180GGH7_PUCT1|nr:hypothetical protein PTTG_27895 [Puccinia triticina 1-1 BBBD Race 1]